MVHEDGESESEVLVTKELHKVRVNIEYGESSRNDESLTM